MSSRFACRMAVFGDGLLTGYVPLMLQRALYRAGLINNMLIADEYCRIKMTGAAQFVGKVRHMMHWRCIMPALLPCAVLVSGGLSIPCRSNPRSACYTRLTLTILTTLTTSPFLLESVVTGTDRQRPDPARAPEGVHQEGAEQEAADQRGSAGAGTMPVTYRGGARVKLCDTQTRLSFLAYCFPGHWRVMAPWIAQLRTSRWPMSLTAREIESAADGGLHGACGR